MNPNQIVMNTIRIKLNYLKLQLLSNMIYFTQNLISIQNVYFYSKMLTSIQHVNFISKFRAFMINLKTFIQVWNFHPFEI